MHNFKELKVWQKAIHLTHSIYKISANFPTNEKYGLSSQIQRCAVSIPSNIAEGCGRNSSKDFLRFLYIANGSSFELETQIIIAKLNNYINENDFEEYTKLNAEVQKMIFGLCQSIEKQEK